MKLSSKLSIDSIDYASQGNAILGIRNSGKSYTATSLAERLMDDNIPFIAFDPIGIWRYLKVGKKGAGYPVVVAGDNGDLPLTPQSAPDIVRAAMKENISLVVDLYSMKLSKKDWRTIVEQSIRLLLYENKPCGLRHIFIEEAAEFCPQRIQPEDGRVYAEIEKLARMGGNASLGYTLINQRPEEVNKAVLENCDCLFLHRQKGRHSLTALGKWLNVADTKNAKEIINSLPSLEQGECWVWLQGTHDPQRLIMPEKKTVHPDRKNPLQTSAGVSSDVSKFVTRMDAWLTALTVKEAPTSPKLKPMVDHSGEVAELGRLLKERDEVIRQLTLSLRESNAIIEKIGYLALTVPVPDLLVTVVPEREKTKALLPAAAALIPLNGTVQSGPLKYLKAAAMFYPEAISKRRMCAMAGTSFKKSTHRAYMAYLKQNELLEVIDQDTFKATEKGMKEAGNIDPLPAPGPELIEMWCNKLGQGPAIYLRTLAKRYPKYIKKQDLAESAGTDYTKSTHRAYMAELNAMGLIVTTADGIKVADELYN